MSIKYGVNPHRAEYENILVQVCTKWHDQLKRITSHWTVAHNKGGEVIDHYPVLQVEFRDGTVIPEMRLDSEKTEGTACQFSDNPKMVAFEAFIRSLVTKHHTELKSFDHAWVRLRNKDGVILDTQPTVDILFKTAEDYAAELSERGERHAH